VEDPHLQARGLFRRIDHPEVGTQTHIGVPWHMTRRPPPAPVRAPLMGEHTDQALQRVLGLTTPELAELRVAGVIE
jgi:crotonobetainyl-CoA:carnitine CoA-transferase CaiB-like acyl-CoA transferase